MEGLRWTVLGAGTIAPHPERSPSGHLLHAPAGPVLVDMGPGTLWRLARAGVAWSELSAAAISHAHLDHFLDLPAMMFSSRAIDHGRVAPLPVVVHPDLMAYVEKQRAAYGRWFEPGGFEIDWRQVVDESLPLAGLTLTVARLRHHHTSLGMRFVAPDGATVVYSGDTEVCPALIKLCEGADLAVLECCSPDGARIPGHMTPGDVAKVAMEAGVRRVAVVHRYPSLDGVDVAAVIAGHGFDGEVVVAEDGTSLEVTVEG